MIGSSFNGLRRRASELIEDRWNKSHSCAQPKAVCAILICTTWIIISFSLWKSLHWLDRNDFRYTSSTSRFRSERNSKFLKDFRNYRKKSCLKIFFFKIQVKWVELDSFKSCVGVIGSCCHRQLRSYSWKECFPCMKENLPFKTSGPKTLAQANMKNVNLLWQKLWWNEPKTFLWKTRNQTKHCFQK